MWLHRRLRFDTIPVCEFKFGFAIRFPRILSILVSCKAITSLLSGRSKFLPSCDTDSDYVTWFPRGTEYRHFAKRPYNSYDQIYTRSWAAIKINVRRGETKWHEKSESVPWQINPTFLAMRLVIFVFSSFARFFLFVYIYILNSMSINID